MSIKLAIFNIISLANKSLLIHDIMIYLFMVDLNEAMAPNVDFNPL